MSWVFPSLPCIPSHSTAYEVDGNFDGSGGKFDFGATLRKRRIGISGTMNMAGEDVGKKDEELSKNLRRGV